MTETVTRAEFNLLRDEIHNLKKEMAPIDDILTLEDLEDIKQAQHDFKTGNTISHEDLKKELGL
ncbi:MAG: hypothetical protein HRU03_08465 [Nanoarchaeales archaeon]|nr:hypothetical protein [Nanoarchaeales archaeon]